MNVIKELDGSLFGKLIIGGALNLKANMKEVNDLNVFPIPDGDTGSNMYMTINGGVDYIKQVQTNDIFSKARALADGMMLNARGNSGVILSQIFNGLANGLKNVNTANIINLCEAFKEAVRQAYSSVVKPVEGTILTVIREATEFINNNKFKYESINSLFEDLIIEMENSLNRTPELLDILKEAGVIDSGGAGLLYIFKGMYDVINGKNISYEETDKLESSKSSKVDFSKFTADSIMEYGYCTEFLLQLQNSKVDIENFDVNRIIEYLSTIGDSIVVFMTGSVVKVHVHSFVPYKALEFCQQFGEFLTIKVENMTLQHNETVKKINKGQKKKYAVVTVATGKGLIETFNEMGVDEVIDGGQGHNPSTRTFIEAFDKVNAENIFVLPNNSNIILTANEAKELYKDSEIFVINTKDLGQGYAALSVLDYSIGNPIEIANVLDEAKENAVTGMITKSVRDANINHVNIKEGDYIGFSNKEMYSSNSSKIDTFIELIEKLNVKNKDFLINVCGKDVKEVEKLQIEKLLKEKYPRLEVYNIDGLQDVYDFIIILE